MSVRSGFFNSLNDDRLYNAEDMSNYYEGLITNGVYSNIDDALKVTPGSDNMTVNVGAGRAMIDCRWIRNSTDLTLDISAAQSLTQRIDSVVVKLDLERRDMTIEVVEGTTSPPDLTDTTTVKYLRLANITVPASSTAISVTDNRGAADCPWVQSIGAGSNIQYYENTVNLSSDTNSVQVGISEYSPTTDKLDVYINGIHRKYA